MDLLSIKYITIKAQGASTQNPEDPDNTWLTNILGKSNQAIKYKQGLINYGLSLKDIRLVVDTITKNNHFTTAEIFKIPIIDFKAILQFIKVGCLKSAAACNVHSQLSPFLLERLNNWFTEIYVNDLNLTAYKTDYYQTTENKYDAILKYYTLVSAKDLPKKLSISLRLFKLALHILAGITVPLPRNRTLHLFVIWAMMLKDMCSISILSIGMVFSIFIETIVHLLKEEVTSILSHIGCVSSITWEALPEKTKTWISQLFGNDPSQKYLCWNKTLSVLVDTQLNESQASRMLSTFTFGSSIKETLMQTANSALFIKRFSPIPSRDSIYDIISFFRDLREYNRRRNSVLALSIIESDKTNKIQERIKISYKTYLTLLKLEIAYIPKNEHNRTTGCFIDPKDTCINNSLISEISESHYLHRDNIIQNYLQLIEYRTKLKKTIKKNPNPDYIDFFGYPKNAYFFIGQKVKHYSSIN